MKRYLLLFFTAITLFSCSNDDDGNYHFEYVPVLSADVPEEFTYGHSYLLTVKYELPNNCYSYYHYDYIYHDTSRIIAPIAIVNDDVDTCGDIITEGEFIIRVQALQSEPYIFKFWQGEDEQGEPIYLVIEVPVIN